MSFESSQRRMQLCKSYDSRHMADRNSNASPGRKNRRHKLSRNESINQAGGNPREGRIFNPWRMTRRRAEGRMRRKGVGGEDLTGH